MFLRIADYHVPDRSLTIITFIEGTPTVVFGGMAREDEGKAIAMKLKALASKGTLRYEAIDPMGVHTTGVGRLANLKIETVSTIPRVVLFSGEIVLPHLRIQS